MNLYELFPVFQYVFGFIRNIEVAYKCSLMIV